MKFNVEQIVSDDIILQEDVIQMLPMVNEADAMSGELDKKVKFELALVSPQARGLKEGKTEVRGGQCLENWTKRSSLSWPWCHRRPEDSYRL